MVAAIRRAIDEHGHGTFETPDEQVRVWSDLHVGHANVIRYSDRPFSDIGAMDAALWDSWRADVDANDTLVCVGDVALSGGVDESTWERIRIAPGSPKVLVIGNHDLTGRGELRTFGFDQTFAMLTTDGDPPLVWTHAPLPKVPAGYVNIHGHLHTHLMPPGSPHINVSVEQIGYRPITLSRLRVLAQALAGGMAPAGSTTLERLAAVEAMDRAR